MYIKLNILKNKLNILTNMKHYYCKYQIQFTEMSLLDLAVQTAECVYLLLYTQYFLQN